LFISRKESSNAIDVYNHKYRLFKRFVQLIGGLDPSSTITVKVELNGSRTTG
jgi:hypothetical protein